MIRFALTFLILAYASLLDLKYRKIDDKSWLALVILGIVFFAIDYANVGSEIIVPFLFSVGLTLILVAVLYYARVMESGDCKILLGISVIIPQPVHPSIFSIFSLGAFTNAIVISLAVPLFFFIYNLGRLGDVKSAREFLVMFLGYKRKGNRIRPYEALMEGEDGLKIFLDTRTIELGRKLPTDREVWVSPAIPFVVLLTMGLLIAVLFGDFISYIYVKEML